MTRQLRATHDAAVRARGGERCECMDCRRDRAETPREGGIDEQCPVSTLGGAIPCQLRRGHNSPHENRDEGGTFTWEPRYVSDLRAKVDDLTEDVEAFEEIIARAMRLCEQRDTAMVLGVLREAQVDRA